jgi:hypothetical protein
MLLRFLAEGAATPGSAARKNPVDGCWSFPVTAGDTEKLTLDFTGWLGGATVTAQSFTSSDVTLSSVAEASGVVTALAAIPAAGTAIPYYAQTTAYQLVHSCTASDGRKKVTTFYLATQ